MLCYYYLLLLIRTMYNDVDKKDMIYIVYVVLYHILK
jgi:hypothetical protein